MSILHMKKYFVITLTLLVIVFGMYSIILPDASAHRSGCHRWHSCPSDTGSYTCGDTGYCSGCPDNNYCKAGQSISLSSSGYSSNSDISSSSSSSASTSSNLDQSSTIVTPTQEISQKIPNWIKNNAKFWSDGEIGDSDFVKGIQYLLEQGIVKVSSSPGGNLQNSNHIPVWIKNDAKWWSEDQIDDSEFVKGIQYLVQSGIIRVSTVQPQSNETEHTPNQQSIQTSSDYSIPTSCQAVNNDTLPDPNCTPGTIDPRVTQDNIDSTICVPGYTKTVRPSVSYTEPLKFKLMAAYGFTDSASNYELDHLISLELGGSPDSVKNLWPEPHYTNPNSFDKDGLENYLHKQVCSGQIDLKTAQYEIASDWIKYWDAAEKP